MSQLEPLFLMKSRVLISVTLVQSTSMHSAQTLFTLNSAESTFFDVLLAISQPALFAPRCWKRTISVPPPRKQGFWTGCIGATKLEQILYRYQCSLQIEKIFVLLSSSLMFSWLMSALSLARSTNIPIQEWKGFKSFQSIEKMLSLSGGFGLHFCGGKSFFKTACTISWQAETSWKDVPWLL